MVLTAQGKFIDTSPIESLFTQGEKYSDRIYFVLPPVNNDVDVSGCTFVMRTVASDSSMTETMLDVQYESEQILLTWNIPETVTAVAGMLQLELVGSRGSDVIIKYKMPAIFVKGAVMGGSLPVPDIIEEKLAQMNDILAQAQAKLEEAKSIAADIIDPTLTISEKAADAKATGDRFAELQQSVDNIMQNLSSGVYAQMLMEVIAARTSSISGEEFSTLSERLASDFANLQKVMQAVDVVSPYIVVDIEKGDDIESNYYANDTLRITGTGSIDASAFEHREDFSAVEIDIGGNVGVGAFGGCTELNTASVNCLKIGSNAFMGCSKLSSITIGKNVTEIGSGILTGSGFYIPNGVRIMYAGTIAQWNAITKAENWIGDNVTVENGVLICTDGNVEV
ncbi:MAG: leucine-rich repeat protein [Ruminococcus sp.]|nr:leucine-rich repeat protein [Ruminococcus sp.]